jgi:hypothetical protein
VAEARSKTDVLRRTRDLLGHAQRGLSEIRGIDPTARPMGMHNVAIYGRSVTLVLQTLRTIDRDAFDAWYAPFQAEMTDDPLFRYFTRLRNEVLKEGPPETSMTLYMENLTSEVMARLKANPPPGAQSFFIGDRVGGSGWEVELPDGSVETVYTQLPPDLPIEISLRLPDPPERHLEVALVDPSLEDLARLYVDYLTKLVDEAEGHFGS